MNKQYKYEISPDFPNNGTRLYITDKKTGRSVRAPKTFNHLTDDPSALFPTLADSEAHAAAFTKYHEITQDYAVQMANKLAKNAHKGSWEISSLPYYLAMLKSEVYELEGEVCLIQLGQDRLDKLVAECIDIMNFAMIVAEVADRLQKGKRRVDPV
jgi:hypothetical protein